MSLSLTSPNALDLFPSLKSVCITIPEFGLFIRHSNEFQQSSFIIPLTENTNYIVHHTSNSEYNLSSTSQHQLQSLNIQLKDSDGNFLENCNSDWDMLFELS